MLVVDQPDVVRQPAVPLGLASTAMLLIVAGMVVVLATAIVPAAVGVLLAAMAVVGFCILSVEAACRAIDWNTIILLAAMMLLSTAMQQSGTAEQLAELLVRTVGDAGPMALLVGLFLPSQGDPRAGDQQHCDRADPDPVAVAIEFNIMPLPVLMSLNGGASAAFLTPVATPPNLIVMVPAGYRFGDDWKLGLGLALSSSPSRSRRSGCP